MLRKIVLGLFPALFFGMSSPAAQDLSAFQTRVYVSAGGDTLPYRILYPERYDATRRYPLILVLHGAGERGRDNAAQLTNGGRFFLDPARRRQFPAIVVFPQCPAGDLWSDQETTPAGGAWEYPFRDTPRRPQALVMALLDSLQRHEAVDADRLYLMGLSMGGFGVFDLLARQPERFAAAASIGGGGNLHLARLYAPHTALWLFHGARDEVVPVAQSRLMHRRLRALGAAVRYTEYPTTGYNAWDPALAEAGLLPWLFARSRRPGAERRFREPVFDSVMVSTFAYSRKGTDTLSLDVYRPVGDTAGGRPLLLYVHGGGFAGGQRDGRSITEFAHQMTRLGYIVASMSYRLTMRGRSFHCDQPALNKIFTFQLAVEDIRDATNFLLARADSLGVDPARIVLAGSSAGAEAVLHAAYWRDADMLPASPRLPDGFRYAGVIGMAGALVDDARLIDQASAIPTQLFHGTCDPLVPFATASHHYCRERQRGYLMLAGSYTIAEWLREAGRPFYLVSVCNGGHEWNDKPMQDHVEEIVDFLVHDVLEGAFRQIHYRFEQAGECRLNNVRVPEFCGKTRP